MEQIRKEFEEWFEMWLGEEVGKFIVVGNLGLYEQDYTQSHYKCWLAAMKSAWISCSDRMPDIGLTVLCHEGDGCSSLFYRGDGFWDDGDFNSHITGVTHWQHLPAGPDGL